MPAARQPHPSPLFLGIDIGTSGLRLSLIDETGRIAAMVREPLPPSRRAGPATEQDPEHWWQALVAAFRQLDPDIRLRIAAIAIDGTSGTVLLAGANGRPRHPALMYDDARAVNEAESLKAIAPPQSPVHAPTSGLARLLWLARQPCADQARHALHQADWLLGRLAGRFGDTDVNNALKTGYDPVARHWPEWLDRTGLPRAWLPNVHSAGTPLFPLDPKMAPELGLAPGILLVAGTTDSTAAFLATGASCPGDAVTCLGSTLVLKVLSERPVSAPDYGIYSQPLGDLWLVGGASNSGGAVLKQFFTDAQMQALETRLHPEKPTGYHYYPLTGIGERFPHNDPERLPRLEPRPDDEAIFFQALLEGIADIEAEGYRRLAECGAPWPTSVRTTGGGAANRGWTRIRARRLQVPLREAEQTEAACGTARLARAGYEKKIKETR